MDSVRKVDIRQKRPDPDKKSSGTATLLTMEASHMSYKLDIVKNVIVLEYFVICQIYVLLYLY
jgi:hypothetical protein